jgi:hypothetical protein
MTLFKSPKHTITEEEKLIIALRQVDNLTILLKDNEYEHFLYSRIISVKYELERQLAKLTNSPYYPIIEE